METSAEELRKLTRMVHDKLWLEESFGIDEGPGFEWPEAAKEDSAGGESGKAHARGRPGSSGASQPESSYQAPDPVPYRPAAQPPPPLLVFQPVHVEITDCSPEPGDFLENRELSKKERLDLLWQKARVCTRCGLAKGRQTVVYGEGNPEAELMFIGEGPGHQEDLSGRPFVGKAGQLLDRIIQAIDLKREEVYIANIVKCHPPGDRSPTPEESQSCLPYLLAQIEIIRPKVICLLGATAARTMTNTDMGITRMRGHWYQFNGIPMMPTFHPAYLLRNETKKRPTWEDMQLVRDKIHELRETGG